MTLLDYSRILRERWIVVVSVFVASTIAASSVFFLSPQVYTAKLTFYVSAQTVDTTQNAYLGAQLSQERVTSYVALVNSTRICTEVIGSLRLAITPDTLKKQIIASTQPDSVLIDVSVQDQSPQRAAQIANAVGELFPALVDELERPTAGVSRTSPTVVHAVQPATVPTSPSSPGLLVFIVLGCASGALLGAAAAWIRHIFDRSVKSPGQLRDLTRVPNLGAIELDGNVSKRPLTVHDSPHSPRSEVFRQLRTNLQFVDVDHDRKVLIVSSALPGEGKTTTLANLAIAIASIGQRVLVIDADLRRPKLAEILGLDRAVGLTTVLSGRVSIEHATQSWSGGGFDVLASGHLPPNPSELLGSRQMRLILEDLRLKYDVVLIDTPPLLPVTDAAALAPGTDGVLLVCRYKRTSTEEVRTAAVAINSVSVPILGTVLTMVPASGRRAYAKYSSLYAPESQPSPARPSPTKRATVKDLVNSPRTEIRAGRARPPADEFRDYGAGRTKL